MCDEWVRVHLVRDSHPKNNFQQFYLIKLNTNQNRVWNDLQVALIWKMWTQRNKIISTKEWSILRKYFIRLS